MVFGLLRRIERLRRVRGGLLLALMLLFVAASSASAQTIGFSIRDTTGVESDTIVVPVRVDSLLDGRGVYSYELELTYDANYYQALAVERTGTLSAGMGSFSANVGTAGRIRVAAASDTPMSGRGVLFNIRLRLKAPNSWAEIGFNAAASTLNEGSPGMNFDPGRVSITALPDVSLSPGNVTLLIGRTQQFSAWGGTAPYSWVVADTSIANVDGNGLLTAAGVGTTTVTVADADGYAGTNQATVEVRGFELSVRDTSAYENQVVKVPLRTTSLDALGVLSGEVSITFSGSVLELTGVETTGTLLDGANVTFGASSGSATVAFASDAVITGSGALVDLVFKTKETDWSTSSGINIGSAILNENLRGTVENGSFQVQALPVLSVSPSTATLLAGETRQFTVSGATGKLTWSVSDSSIAGINTTGLLTALKGGKVQVSVQDSLGATGTSGNITINDLQVSISDTSGVAGDTVLVPVRVSNLLSGSGILALEAAVTYDAAFLTLIGVETSGALAEGWSFTTNATSGKLTLAGAGSTVIDENGVLFYLAAKIDSTRSIGQTTTLTLQSLVLNEGSPIPVLDPGVVTVSVPVDRRIASDRASVDFGTVSIGTTAKQTITLTNVGPDDVTGEATVSGVGYAIASGGGSFTVAGGATHEIVVDFAPTAEQAYAGSLSITHNATNAASPLVVSLDGTGSLANQAPAAPVIVQPADGTTILLEGDLSTTVEFAWEAATDPDGDTVSYDWLLSDDETFADTLLVIEAGSATNVTLTYARLDSLAEARGVAPGGTLPLWFYVSASDGTLQSSSALVSIQVTREALTTNNPPDVPVGLNPAEGTEILVEGAAEATVAFTWQASTDPDGGTISYEWQLSDDVAFGDTLMAEAATATSISITYAALDSLLAAKGVPAGGSLTLYYRVLASDGSSESVSTVVSVTVTRGVLLDADGSDLPAANTLEQNYPNPVRTWTMIRFVVEKPGHVQLTVFNVVGKEVARLVDGTLPAGAHDVSFDAASLPSGAYFYRIESESFTATRRMMIVK